MDVTSAGSVPTVWWASSRAGSVGRDRSGEAPILELGAVGDVKSYLGRMGFFQAADRIFAAGTAFPRRFSGPSDVPAGDHTDHHEQRRS